jgi:hypothetical protein
MRILPGGHGRRLLWAGGVGDFTPGRYGTNYQKKQEFIPMKISFSESVE